MSNTNDPTRLTDVSIEKQPVAKRVVGFVKTHKKATIAVAVVGGLVAVNAIANRLASNSVTVLDADGFAVIDTPVA